jgi:hypothetical protein
MHADFISRGQVIDDTTSKPIYQAVLQVEGIEHNVTTTKNGEFWRLLVPKQDYKIRVSADNYITSDFLHVHVPDGGDPEMKIIRLRRATLPSIYLEQTTKNSEDRVNESTSQVRVNIKIIVTTVPYTAASLFVE